MRRTIPDRRALAGFNLIELVVAIVIVGIVIASVAYFVFPVRQAVDIALRAELTDIADTALRRVGRDVRLALPNSVRVNSDATNQWVEFLAIRTAGRYRAEGGGGASGANCPADEAALGIPDNDVLSFDVAADTCFKTIGKLPNVGTVIAGDQLVLNNYGSGFTGQDAYQSTGTLNRSSVSAVDSSEASRDRIAFSSTTFQRALHDSPGRRFFVVSGPVTYHCNLATGQVIRYAGYAIAAPLPGQVGSNYASGTSAVIASRVTACVFDYTPNVASQVGLLTLRLTLAATTSSGLAESVSLYSAVHVNNVP